MTLMAAGQPTLIHMTEPYPVVAAARRRSTALVNKDEPALLSLLHPNFLYVNANGQVLNREQYLDQYVRADEVRWISQEIDQPVLAESDTAVVMTCLVHDVARYLDHELDETFRSTLTWVQGEQGWLCLGGHTSPLPT
jgi:Domain of unknown function (DUF4440)